MAAKKDEAAPQKDLLSTDAPGDVARFEQALDELEQIVAKLERGELKLEESLALFERGMQLTRQCRQSLETAELKVKQLLASDAASAGDASA